MANVAVVAAMVAENEKVRDSRSFLSRGKHKRILPRRSRCISRLLRPSHAWSAVLVQLVTQARLNGSIFRQERSGTADGVVTGLGSAVERLNGGGDSNAQAV